MREYLKPSIEEEVLELEDIIAASLQDEYDTQNDNGGAVEDL